jgi:flagellar protein FlaF
MSYNGYAAYKTAQIKADDPRDVEYRLLAQVTGALMAARDNSDNDIRPKIDAILWNAQIWSALRTDLCSDHNQLSKELRASIISLSLWIERETNAIMDGAGDIDALIEVNRNIMVGLKPNHNKNDHTSATSPEMSSASVL